MQYRITLLQSAEGWAVSCPTLPGCHSQGATRKEAIENIKVAIREWLESGEPGLLKSLDVAAKQLDAGQGMTIEVVRGLVRQWAAKYSPAKIGTMPERLDLTLD